MLPLMVNGVSIIWPNVNDVTVVRANQFLLQATAGPTQALEDIVLTIGYLSPPVMLGSPEEQEATANALSAVAVNTVGRIAMSYERARELRDVLETTLTSLDEMGGNK